jgi:HD-GYP domain-containing protein (c-di-GMP phosphodiesterase class II)
VLLVPQNDVRNLDELQNLLVEDPRFSDYRVSATGDGWFEVRFADGGLMLASARLARDRAALEPHLVRSASGCTMLLLFGAEDELTDAAALPERCGLALVPLPLSRARLWVTLKNYRDFVTLRARDHERGRVAERYKSELSELISIARAISSERDIHTLLGLILERSRYVTGADAGSVYIVEGQSLDPRQRTLHFMVSQNDSRDLDFSEYTLPVDEKTIVGQAVIKREPINIPDVRKVQNRRFDETSGYQTRSMLTVPMVNQRDEVIGVIQLINRRKEGAPRLCAPLDFDNWVIPFEKREEELSTTLAAQAGISLENTLLYEDIRALFEGFVEASVKAIESRDPTTSGHSQRVATLTVGLAELVDRQTTGAYRSVHFTPDDLMEIKYAALLHDFGKVGVREQVLVKAKKLYENERDLVLSRFDYIRKWIESDALRRKLDLVLREGVAAAERHFGELDVEEKRRLAQLDEFVAFILRANEPTVLAAGGFERLAEIAEHRYVDPRGDTQPYLTASEVGALKLARGSLTAEERLAIESHVKHTFDFLSKIPWGRRLGDIPEIAGSHHEKLDGTGYPLGLRGEAIRIESRMMTIADIFDALTASDRPYKKAVALDKALDILHAEVKDGKCDAELMRLFVESRVWQRVLAPG